MTACRGTMVVLGYLLSKEIRTTLRVMLRSLLFSSHSEIANPLLQALRELDLTIDHSMEIFAAIRELTSRTFDLIVVDLDEGPEAEFLLKAASELSINRKAFVLAVAEDANRPRLSQVDLVLVKPLMPEQIKYSLLDCDRFLVAYMRGGVQKVDASKLSRVTEQPTRAISPVVSPLTVRQNVHRH
jgi:hypothetical protein